MTKIINGGGTILNVSRFAIVKKLSLILLLCLTRNFLYSQNQVLTKQNGGVSWQEVMGGGANVRAVRTSNQTILSSTNTTVTFSSEDYDVNNTFDPSTGIFTPPQAGYYVIKASVNWSNTNTTSGERRVRLCKNGTSSVLYQNSEDGSGSMHSSIHTVIYSDGTDNYRVVVWQNSGSSHDINGSPIAESATTFTAFNLSPLNQEILKKKSGGVSWENQTSTCVKARLTTLTSIPSVGATITYSTEDFDVNNSFNPSTGIFTPAEAGYYVIMASINWPSISNTAMIQLRKNTFTRVEQHAERGNGKTQSSLHTIFHSNGSDNYSIMAWQGTGGNSSISSAEITIYKLPNPNEERLAKVDGGVSWEQQSSSLIKAKRTSNLSIPSGTNTTISYSSEDFDVNTEFNPSTGVFTPSEAGYYKIMATANWDIFNGNSGTREIRLVKRTGVSSTVLQKTNSESGSGQMVSSLHTVVYYDGSSGLLFMWKHFRIQGQVMTLVVQLQLQDVRSMYIDCDELG